MTGSPAAGVVASTAFAAAVWGTTYVVTTLFLPEGYPLWSGVLRALPAGLIALGLSRSFPRGTWWWKALVLGVLNIGAFFPLLFVAAYLLPGGVAAIFGATGPLIVAALALPLIHERPTVWRLGWGVFGVVGVTLMVLGPEASLDWLGILAGLASTVCMAFGTVLSKKWGRPAGPVAYAGWLLTAGGLAILPLALVVEGAPPAADAEAVGGYAWLGLVGALLSYVLWFRGVGRLPAGAVAFLPLVSPLVATVLGWVVLEEALTSVQMVGFLVALLAVACASQTPPRFTHPDPPVPAELGKTAS